MAKKRSGIHLIAKMANVSIGPWIAPCTRVEGSRKPRANEFFKLPGKSAIPQIWPLALCRLPKPALELEFACLGKFTFSTTSFGEEFWSGLAASDSWEFS